MTGVGDGRSRPTVDVELTRALLRVHGIQPGDDEIEALTERARDARRRLDRIWAVDLDADFDGHPDDARSD